MFKLFFINCGLGVGPGVGSRWADIFVLFYFFYMCLSGFKVASMVL